MTIDLILVSLQTLFLSLYGVNGLVHSTRVKKVYWVAVFATFSGLAVLYIFLAAYLEINIQLIVFILLMLNYILHLGSSTSRRLEKTLVHAGIVFVAYTLIYFKLELSVIWLIAPFVLITIAGLINQWPAFLANLQEYFLKAGALLTMLFMIEPVALSVQQNMKPVATIPVSSIINQQNFLLLGVLVVLVLVGFFWKEKSRL
ncbi:MAG: hypothetical protein AAFN93_17110 [Bacteroidota bacterium]